MRIATWNVNSLRVRLPQLTQWLQANPVDVIGLQELKQTDEDFPAAEIASLGLHAAWYGQKTYNGVAILARKPLEDVAYGIPGFDDPQRRVIAATVDGVRLINVYVPNGQAVGSEKYAYKLDWLGRLADYVTSQLALHPRLAIVGDYNIAPEDRDVHDPAKWEGSVHVSAAQPPEAYSWWDYRMGAFRRNHGLRIDLVLASRELASSCIGCHVDRTPRTWERPSDHAPVLATFDIG
jgi:exodeoxyribonuclease-3